MAMTETPILSLAGVAFAIIAFVSCVASAADGDATAPAPPADGSETTQTALHAQSTLIYQGNLPFHAPYRGDNSLKSKGETKDTWTVTPAAGVRLWAGSELYFNPELFQGFGLAGTHGAAGFYNGEAQKGGSSIPEASVARIFLRQVWGFGGEQEMVKDDFNQLGGPRDVSRVTLTVGKISVSDLFDDNSYAHDPRTSFFNWSIWEAGAFDFAANHRMLSTGEYNLSKSVDGVPSRRRYHVPALWRSLLSVPNDVQQWRLDVLQVC